jgi:carboxyl-terminal processing protease
LRSLLLALAAHFAPSDACEKDVAFALPELEKRCATLLAQKQVDWKKVDAEMKAAAKAAKDDSDHLLVLMRLVARLKDGHAEVLPLPPGKQVKLPARYLVEHAGPGLFFCRSGGKLVVKSAWAGAAAAGVKPGMEVVKVDGKAGLDWIAARVAELRDTECWSTDQHAFFAACHWGLAFPVGTRLELELKDAKGKKLARTVTCDKASQVPDGPAFLPDGLAATKDLKHGKTVAGFGYVHVRRSPADLPEQMDSALAALAALGKVPGLILDFRGNSGGSFDHDALMGRFVPAGETMGFGKSYASAGATPYGGPIVVIVDATVRSAGETAAGMFKEDGRAYSIGESATAGMSAQKEQFDLPSGKWALYFAVSSNKGRFNDGRGIEGIGVIPHETVELAAKDLAAGVDTLIARAEALLKKFPQAKVPYDAGKFGWK